MSECIYCTDFEKRDSLMIKICDLPKSEVFLLRDQWHPGRCVVAYKGHKTEYFHLTAEENQVYFAEIAQVAKAVDAIYHPDKINYMTLGDEMPHIHVHVVPKKRDQESWNGYFNGRPKAFLTDEEYQTVVENLKSEILKG